MCKYISLNGWLRALNIKSLQAQSGEEIFGRVILDGGNRVYFSLIFMDALDGQVQIDLKFYEDNSATKESQAFNGAMVSWHLSVDSPSKQCKVDGCSVTIIIPDWQILAEGSLFLHDPLGEQIPFNQIHVIDDRPEASEFDDLKDQSDEVKGIPQASEKS